MNNSIDIKNFVSGLSIPELEETLFVFSESLRISEKHRKDPKWILKNISAKSKNEMASVVIEISKSLVKRKRNEK